MPWRYSAPPARGKFQLPQRLAELALVRGAEGLRVPSATRLGANLIVFPLNLQPTSALSVVGSRAPRLYISLP